MGRRVSFLRSDWRDESKVGSVTESKVLKIFDQKILDGMVDVLNNKTVFIFEILIHFYKLYNMPNLILPKHNKMVFSFLCPFKQDSKCI